MAVDPKVSEKFRPFQKLGYLQMSILLPLMCCLVLDKVSERDSIEMAVLHWGMLHSPQQKILKYCLTASSGGFEYGISVVR
jgi:hypothetical protein